MTLIVISLLCRPCYAHCDEMAEARIMWLSVHYNVGLYLSYLLINSDDEIKGNSFESQA